VTTAEQPAVTKAIVENQQPHAETLKTAAIDRQPAATEVMPEYEPLQLLTVAKPAATISAVAVNAQPAPQTASLPNVTKVAESPVTSTPVAKLRMEQAEVVTVPSAENKPAATPPEQPVEAVTAVQNQPQKIETVKAMPFADSRHDQTAVTPASTQAPLLATLSQESILDIQLSQPRPITARVTAAVVSSDSRIASQLQDIRGARQRPGSEPQNEKSRTVDEQNVVKELAPLLQSAVSASEPTFAASTFEGDNNQELPVGVIAGKQLAQDLPGQLSADHQKISTVISKPVSIESARQEIPERVMQQVKDRLVQHEVKAGNQQITLTLSPDSLGELKMNLNLQGQKLSVEIVTENRSVRDAIVQHSDALKESLARQNITMESFDVTTGGKGSGNSGTNQNAWREMAKQQQQQQFWTSPRGYNTAQTDLSSGQAYPKQPGHSMLDIHY
jgi:flagellar hook-length control protein FliK